MTFAIGCRTGVGEIPSGPPDLATSAAAASPDTFYAGNIATECQFLVACCGGVLGDSQFASVQDCETNQQAAFAPTLASASSTCQTTRAAGAARVANEQCTSCTCTDSSTCGAADRCPV